MKFLYLTVSLVSLISAHNIDASENKNKRNKIATVSSSTFSNCDFNGTTNGDTEGPLQRAINSPNNYDEIRVTAGTYRENIVINDRAIIIRGNYNNCDDAVNDIQLEFLETQIEGQTDAGQATFRISGDSKGLIRLEQLFIQDAKTSAGNNGGGIHFDNTTATVELEKLFIFGNEAQSGGGVSIDGGAVNIEAVNVDISLNDAQQGGGIYCNSANSSIQMINTSSDDAGIDSNKALNGDGGGILLENGCQFTSYISAGLVGDLRELRANRATGNGGGIAVKSGSKATFIGYQDTDIPAGDSSIPILISFNKADSDNDGDGDGGAIYITDADSTVSFFHGMIRNNSASNGGGVAVNNGGRFEIQQKLNRTCWQNYGCNQIINNTATQSGGAVYAANGSQASINMTHITNNRSNLGTAATAENTNSQIQISNTLINNNGNNGNDGFSDESLIEARSGAQIKTEFSTIVNNDVSSAIINNNSASTNTVYSIIHNSQAVIDLYSSDNNDTNHMDCLLTDNLNGVNNGATNQIQINVDPLFVNPAENDFHLQQQSPAIDACPPLGSDLPIIDIDRQARPFDNPGVTNNLGTYDIGFDEFYDASVDLIFKNDFDQ